MSDITLIGPDNEVLLRRTLAPDENAHFHFYISVDAAPPPFRTLRPGQFVVDLSHWQENVDAQVLHDIGGVEAAAIKCTDGLSVDSKFRQNWASFKQAGILRSPFHFWRTLDSTGQRLSGRRQAETFLDTLGRDRGELHPNLDYEPAVISQPHASISELELFGDLMPDGYRVYSSPSMWIGQRLRRTRVWAADYTEPLDVMRPYALGDVVLWQVGVTSLPGIVGWVDINIVVEGMTPPIDFPNWVYKRTPWTGPDKDKLYTCSAASSQTSFYDKPRGTIHTTRRVTSRMDVWKVSLLDQGWVCVVEGSKPWWLPVSEIVL